MADPQAPTTDRVIDLSVEVVGTPEEVWAAVATGPGISSWFVPTTVDEREGGTTTSKFGEGPEMLIPGVVAVWEPPHRVRFESAAPEAGLAFEWLVEARGQGTCVVRLINSGFGSGEEWDAQFDGMSQGWLLFLHNLQLHRAHFPGQVGVAALPMAMLPGPRANAWATLLSAAGLPTVPASGERVRTAGAAPPLSGTVVEAEPWRLSLVVDEPAPGTAILAAEGDGDQVGVSVWLYLYGPEASQVAARQQSLWQEWLTGRASAG
jgi:uncharacterized protein YndB with AHSA1/START domain